MKLFMSLCFCAVLEACDKKGAEEYIMCIMTESDFKQWIQVLAKPCYLFKSYSITLLLVIMNTFVFVGTKTQEIVC